MICINGGGIAGLTLANCLSQLHIDYVIIEKAPQLQTLGAGIAMQQNGLAILQALDLFDDLNAAKVKQMQVGRLGHTTTIDNNQYNLPMYAIHRGQLQQLLVKNLDKSNIRFGQQIQTVQQNNKQVTVTLADGETLDCQLLVEASGIHGSLHALPQLKNANQWCWRSIVKGKQKLNHGGEFWFGKNRIGIVPISPLESDDNDYYVFQVLDGVKDIDSSIEQQRLAWLDEAKSQIPLLANLALSEAQWLSHPLSQRKINWGDKRIIAIGDAAHALTPNLGQGAVLAMEDAYCLANLLQSGIAVDKLLSALIKKRHNRVAAIQKTSRQAGKVAHFSHPIAVALRDFALSLMPTQLAVKQQQRFVDQFIRTMVPLS